MPAGHFIPRQALPWPSAVPPGRRLVPRDPTVNRALAAPHRRPRPPSRRCCHASPPNPAPPSDPGSNPAPISAASASVHPPSSLGEHGRHPAPHPVAVPKPLSSSPSPVSAFVVPGGTVLRTIDPIIAAASAARAAAAAATSFAPAAAAGSGARPGATHGTFSSVSSMEEEGGAGGGPRGVRLLIVVGVVLLDDPEWAHGLDADGDSAAAAAAAAVAGVATGGAAGGGTGTQPVPAAAAAAVEAAAAAAPAAAAPVAAAAGAGASERPVRVLLAQRPEGKSNAGLWEFPGGKVDPGETPEAALVRELHEELGITVEPRDLQPLTFASHTYPAFHLLMPLYACRRWQGEPRGAEGQAVAWARAEEVAAFALTPADIPLLPAVLAAMRGGGGSHAAAGTQP